MYKRILIPLDGSELAEVALPYATYLAGKLGSETTLILVNEPGDSQYHRMHQFYIERMVDITKNSIERYPDRPGKKAVKVNSAILEGHPAEHIVDYAEARNIDLIVMATHGKSGIRRWVLGSVADKVMSATNRPVMLIRGEGARPDAHKRGLLNKMLVPLDASKESEAVLPYVKEVASKLKAKVVLLHVVPPASTVYAIPGATMQFPYTQADVEMSKMQAEDYLNGVGSEVKSKGISVVPEVRIGSAAGEIIDAADDIDADITVMSSHGISGIGRWAFGSTVDKVLRAGTTPLLLVRIPSD